MAHTDLTGVLVALVTPFTADGSEIDVAALAVRELLRDGDRRLRRARRGLRRARSSPTSRRTARAP